MATTFEVINDDNTVLIDDEHKSLQLYDKRTVNVPRVANMYYLHFQMTCPKVPLVCVRPLGQIAAVCTGIRDTGNNIYSITIVAAGVTSVEVFTFIEASITPSTYGLQLFNQNGELTFDALSKWLKVVKLFDPMLPPSGNTLLPDSTKKYAYTHCTCSRGWTEDAFIYDGNADITFQRHTSAGFFTADNKYYAQMGVVTENIFYSENRAGQSGPDNEYDEKFVGTNLIMLVDVTNY